MNLFYTQYKRKKLVTCMYGILQDDPLQQKKKEAHHKFHIVSLLFHYPNEDQVVSSENTKITILPACQNKYGTVQISLQHAAEELFWT